MNHINLVGVEIEGGWEGSARGIGPFLDGTVLVDDQSLYELKSFHIGEAVSPALPLKEVLGWAAKHHPDEVTIKCGLHVHVSFKTPREYLLVTSRKFNRYFREFMEKWGKEMGLGEKHEFWKRLRGENKYCRPHFAPVRQMRRTTKHPPSEGHHPTHPKDERRTQLNFPYQVHKTVECRLMPMFKSKKMVKNAIIAVVACFETYLERAMKEEQLVPFNKEAQFFSPRNPATTVTHVFSVPMVTGKLEKVKEKEEVQ